MRKFYLIPFLFLVACGGEGELPKDSTDDDQLIQSTWVEPIDTMDVILENFWEASGEMLNTSLFLYPDDHWHNFLGRRYNNMYLHADTLVFQHCNDGVKYDCRALLTKATEDTLVLKFFEEHEYTPAVGSQFAFVNDRIFWNEDFHLNQLSFCTADHFQHFESYSIEFDASTITYKKKTIQGGRERVYFQQGDMPEDLFKEFEQLVSKIYLPGEKFTDEEMELFDPFRLVISHDGETDELEGVLVGLHPRLWFLIEKLEDANGENMESISDYEFKAKEYPLENIFPTMIFEVPDEEEVIEEMDDSF